MENYQDFTIKASVKNPEEMKARLQQLGAEFIGVDDQIDHYFETDRGKLKWRQGTIENLITHYERRPQQGLEHTIVYRYEVNPGSDAIAELQQAHTLLGIVKKQRSIFWLAEVKIHLDKVGESFFVELEAIDRGKRIKAEELQARCRHVQKLLGVSEEEIIPTGYLES